MFTSTPVHLSGAQAARRFIFLGFAVFSRGWGITWLFGVRVLKLAFGDMMIRDPDVYDMASNRPGTVSDMPGRFAFLRFFFFVSFSSFLFLRFSFFWPEIWSRLNHHSTILCLKKGVVFHHCIKLGLLLSFSFSASP